MSELKNKSRVKKTICLADKYKDFYQERHKPVSSQYIEDLAHDLLNWSDKPDSLQMCSFLKKYPWPPSQFYQWAKKHNYLYEAWQIARLHLCDNRESWVIKDPRQFPVYARNQAKYDDEYKELIEWREKLKTVHKEESSHVFNIIMPPAENHPAVPERKEKTIPKNAYELESNGSD